MPLAVLAILIGAQLSRLLFALGAEHVPSDWDIMESAVGSTNADEILRYVKWWALGALFWAW
jgi:hypothetical protein